MYQARDVVGGWVWGDLEAPLFFYTVPLLFLKRNTPQTPASFEKKNNLNSRMEGFRCLPYQSKVTHI